MPPLPYLSGARSGANLLARGEKREQFASVLSIIGLSVCLSVCFERMDISPDQALLHRVTAAGRFIPLAEC